MPRNSIRGPTKLDKKLHCLDCHDCAGVTPSKLQLYDINVRVISCQEVDLGVIAVGVRTAIGPLTEGLCVINYQP